VQKLVNPMWIVDRLKIPMHVRLPVRDVRNETDCSPALVPPHGSDHADTSEDEAYNGFFRRRAATKAAYVLTGPSSIAINVRDIATVEL
jgi:hypothetical protein